MAGGGVGVGAAADEGGDGGVAGDDALEGRDVDPAAHGVVLGAPRRALRDAPLEPLHLLLPQLRHGVEEERLEEEEDVERDEGEHDEEDDAGVGGVGALHRLHDGGPALQRDELDPRRVRRREAVEVVALPLPPEERQALLPGGAGLGARGDPLALHQRRRPGAGRRAHGADGVGVVQDAGVGVVASLPSKAGPEVRPDYGENVDDEEYNGKEVGETGCHRH